MLQTVLWALLTGGVTGAVWMGIVLRQRRVREQAEARAVLDAAYEQLDALPDTDARLAELEQRLDAAERALVQERAPESSRRITPGPEHPPRG